MNELSQEQKNAFQSIIAGALMHEGTEYTNCIITKEQYNQLQERVGHFMADIFEEQREPRDVIKGYLLLLAHEDWITSAINGFCACAALQAKSQVKHE